jgi:hypothetical protein
MNGLVRIGAGTLAETHTASADGSERARWRQQPAGVPLLARSSPLATFLDSGTPPSSHSRHAAETLGRDGAFVAIYSIATLWRGGASGSEESTISTLLDFMLTN